MEMPGEKEREKVYFLYVYHIYVHIYVTYITCIHTCMCVYVHGDAGRERACTQKTSIHVYILVACTQKTSIHVYILVYIDTCIHTCIHVYIYRAKKKKGVNGLGTTSAVYCVFVYIFVCVYLCVCIYPCVYISMCVYFYV